MYLDTADILMGKEDRPIERCGAPVRGNPEPYDTCNLPTGHKGYHSGVTFDCDGCGRTVRGTPYRSGSTSHVSDEVFSFCFPCVKDGEKPRNQEDYE